MKMVVDTQAKRTLLAVRIWSIYLTLATALLYWFAFVKSVAPPILMLLALLGVFRLIDLWRLRSLGRTFAVSLLFIHLAGPIVYLVFSLLYVFPVGPGVHLSDRATNDVTLAANIVAMLVGISGLIFFNQPAVKALFKNQNQKSTLSNPKCLNYPKSKPLSVVYANPS